MQIDHFCKDDKVVSRNTFLSSGRTERSHKRIVKSNTRLESMIVVSNVERSQFKFFDLRVTLKKLCKIIDTFRYVSLSELREFSESLRVKN